jgi:hypothetical protein
VGVTDLPRPLTDLERSVLEALLAADFPGVETLRVHARTVQVEGRCACGCPTIHFSSAPGRHRLVAEGESDEGQDVLLFAGEQGLDSMESSWTTDSPPASFPPAEALRVRTR